MSNFTTRPTDYRQILTDETRVWEKIVTQVSSRFVDFSTIYGSDHFALHRCMRQYGVREEFVAFRK